MSEFKTYKEYFNIDPKYYAVVTADLIKSGKVQWTSFFPHSSFVNLLEKTHVMLSGQDSRCLWLEGAYGSGKSYAALTLKSLLEANDKDVKEYFSHNGLSSDLCNKLLADRTNEGEILVVYREGTSSIKSDRDLIYAVQSSIAKVLEERGLSEKGSLRDTLLKYLNKESSRNYLYQLIQEEDSWFFGGQSIDSLISKLQSGNLEEQIEYTQRLVEILKSNGLHLVTEDVDTLCQWIKDVIKENNLGAILFIWDEFTEFFINNRTQLTGFQQLTHISANDPFYFMIVTHESSNLLDQSIANKTLDRFVGKKPVRIELPDNMAFQLMHKAMRETDDPNLQAEWQNCKDAINGDLEGVRRSILNSFKEGGSGYASDADLKSVVPIHPYAALLLKYMSVAFHSNARSMFDFIVNNDMKEARGFKWYIENYGPYDRDFNTLTVDMLWDFFAARKSGLVDDVRIILDSFLSVPKGKLTPDQERVFKATLVLEAISLRVNNVELLRPNAQNVDLSFVGTDWTQGKAKSIANGLCDQKFLFRKKRGDIEEYTVANTGEGGEELKKIREQVRKELKTNDLVTKGELTSVVSLPASIKSRYNLAVGTVNDSGSLKVTIQEAPNKIIAFLIFSLDETERTRNESAIRKALEKASSAKSNVYYIECLTLFDKKLLDSYIEDMAYCKYNLKKDGSRSKAYQESADKTLGEWKQNVFNGAFMLYSHACPNGERVANAESLVEKLREIDQDVYKLGLENFKVNDSLFDSSNTKLGVQCGLEKELKQIYKSSNKNTCLSTALGDAWTSDRYWEKAENQGLPIVRIKKEVEKFITEEFEKNSGQVSLQELYEHFETPPFGFLPINITAFILGFVLKEYADGSYFITIHKEAQPATPKMLSEAFDNLFKYKRGVNPKYQDQCLVKMSPQIRKFLECSSKVFDLKETQCGSVESARDSIRNKMRKFAFPIWCLKYLLDRAYLQSSKELVEQTIDDYCGVVNTANVGNFSESKHAENIGKRVLENPELVEDLQELFDSDKCREGMRLFLDVYQDGELPRLASELEDGGAFIERVKEKFNAEAANWVWAQSTAEEKISDVILEYKIVFETRKSLSQCVEYKDVVPEWNNRINNVRIPFGALETHVGDLKAFLQVLYNMKTSGRIDEEKKQEFYRLLTEQRENFESFYKDQVAYFKQVAASFLEDLDNQEVEGFYKELPSGQFTRSSSEYYQDIENKIKIWSTSKKKSVLKALWEEKTGTKDPYDWSSKNLTPILAMFNVAEQNDLKERFKALTYPVSDQEYDVAIEFFKSATFYDRLRDQQEIDRCFKERVVGDYAVLLTDIDDVRNRLYDSVSSNVYDWLGDASVQKKLESLADKEYKVKGYDRVKKICESMDAPTLRSYLDNLIKENLRVGMEILKKSEK